VPRPYNAHPRLFLFRSQFKMYFTQLPFQFDAGGENDFYARNLANIGMSTGSDSRKNLCARCVSMFKFYHINTTHTGIKLRPFLAGTFFCAKKLQKRFAVTETCVIFAPNLKEKDDSILCKYMLVVALAVSML
jgi:hypothetical protein